MEPAFPLIIIDIGGSQSAVAVATSGGGILDRIPVRHPDPPTAVWILESVVDRLDRIRGEHGDLFGKVTRCGIGFGGPIRANRPLRSEHVAGWDRVDLCAEIRRRYGWECRIENDGLAGMLGEYHFGAARGTANAVYLTISTGIGGGAIVARRLYRGSRGFAGHWGHLKLGRDEPLCPCGGRGCFEALCSGTSMARRGREKAAKDPDKAQALIAQAGSIDGMTAKRILDGVREGDPFCCDLWRGIAEDFGRGFASIYHALDPDLIVLGGGVPQAGEVFFDSVRRETEARVLPQFRGEVRIVPAALGTDSVLFGALALALQLD